MLRSYLPKFLPLLGRQYAQNFAKRTYFYFTKKLEEQPAPNAYTLKISGTVKTNLHSLLMFLSQKSLRSEWDLNIFQTYIGDKYVFVEYQKENGSKFEEVITLEYFTDGNVGYIIETITLED